MTDNHTKILIVEDDISSQQYYAFIFKGNYAIKIVPTIQEAKQALKDEKYGIALIDFSLPGGENGLDFIKYLRDEYPEDLPVAIALTANVFPQNHIEALAAGAVEFLTKPIMSQDLLEIIAKYQPASAAEE